MSPAQPAGAEAPPAIRDVIVDTVGRRFVGNGREVVALDRVSINIARGEFVALIGPSGCGKSTLLRLIAGLDEPDEGIVQIRGATPEQFRRKGELGIAFQDSALLPWRTVERNVSLPLEVLGRPRAPARDRIQALIELVGLKGFEKSTPSQLSGGMRQRASIARALVTNPSLLLLDEPFGALDQILRRSMNLELQTIWMRERTTTLLVTHGIDEAIFLADRIAVMQAGPGRIVDIVDVPFSRPRSPELFSDPAFHALEDQLSAKLHGGAAA